MTQEERRIKILEKRLRLLAEYLETFDGSGNAPSFAQFIKSKGVTREMFIKDLPPEYQGVPASGYDRILEYAIRLQELHAGQYRIAEMEEIAADGNNLERGYIKYQPGQYIREDCGCGCGGDCGGGDVAGAMGDDKSSSADGSEEPYLPYLFQEGTEPGLNFAASGTKICIKPIAPFLSPKVAPGMWRSYENKKKKYAECKAAQAASGGYTAAEKAEHIFHANPIGPFTLGRVAFLKLISNNVFGFAQTYERMRKSSNQDHWNKTKKLFYRLGGDPKKLDANVSVGHSKKPIFKPKGWKPKGATTSNGADGTFSADGEVWYNGEAYTAAGIAAIITAATGVISQMAPIIKSFKKDNGEEAIMLEGSYDPNEPGDLPDGSPDDNEGEGLSTTAWIGISVGAALVLGVIGYFAFKGPSKNG